jgi:mRNA interferase RelE/StbE
LSSRGKPRRIRRIDRVWIPKIITAIEGLAGDPRPVGCKKLVGSEHTFRIRVGDYRVIYDIKDNTLVVLVVRIRHRRDVYR